MNKQESQNLMIGSWVLAGGEPRQVSSLTTKKAGFKRGTSGHRSHRIGEEGRSKERRGNADSGFAVLK